MNAVPAAKITMIKGSHKCFVFGLLSLLPLIGLLFAILAMAAREDAQPPFMGFCLLISTGSLIGLPFAAATMVVSVRVRAKEKDLWNVAQPYRIWGNVCAMAGFISSFVIIALVAFLKLNLGVLVG